MLSNISDELYKRLQVLLKLHWGLAWLVLLDIFAIDGAEANEECRDNFHVLLTMVWEGRLHGLLQELCGKWEFKWLQGLRCSPCLQNGDALEAEGNFRG